MKRTVNIFAGIAIFLLGAGLSDISSAGSAECMPTQSDVMGPYYLPDAPVRSVIAGPEEPGEKIVVRGRVLDADCVTPIERALVEIWQTDSKGKYYGKNDKYRLRGQVKTDENGQYQFTTVKPGRYGLMNGYRPAHIHFRVSHPLYDVLVTQLYFQGDPYLLPNDACRTACRSGDPRRIIELKETGREGGGLKEGIFNIVLAPLQ